MPEQYGRILFGTYSDPLEILLKRASRRIRDKRTARNVNKNEVTYAPNPRALRSEKWAVFQFFQMFGVGTCWVGCFLDLARYDLSVTKSTGFAT